MSSIFRINERHRERFDFLAFRLLGAYASAALGEEADEWTRPLANSSIPSTPLPTTTHKAVKAMVKPPLPSASQPVIAGQTIPEIENSVTMKPVATPVRLGKRSAQIE